MKIAGESKRVIYAERYPFKKGHIEDLLTRLQLDRQDPAWWRSIPDGTLFIREIKLVPPPPVEETTEK